MFSIPPRSAGFLSDGTKQSGIRLAFRWSTFHVLFLFQLSFNLLHRFSWLAPPVVNLCYENISIERLSIKSYIAGRALKKKRKGEKERSDKKGTLKKERGKERKNSIVFFFLCGLGGQRTDPLFLFVPTI